MTHSASQIRISIVDDTSRRDCDAGCGTDWSSPDVVDLASRQLEARFGSGASLDYRDLARSSSGAESACRRSIRERGLSVPLLLINDRLRVAGQFDTRLVIDAVEAEMEMGT